MIIKYKLGYEQGLGISTSVNKIIDNEQTMSIPFDSGNTDYQEYLEWLAEGNTPEPADE
jgi:hypothetical protein